jgi:hypothetical protein
MEPRNNRKLNVKNLRRSERQSNIVSLLLQSAAYLMSGLLGYYAMVHVKRQRQLWSCGNMSGLLFLIPNFGDTQGLVYLPMTLN